MGRQWTLIVAGMGVAWKRLQKKFNKQQDSNHFAKRKNINTKSIILIGETKKNWLKSSSRAYQPTWKTLELILSQKINLLRCLNRLIRWFRDEEWLPFYSPIHRLAEENLAFNDTSWLIELIRDSIKKICNRNRLGDEMKIRRRDRERMNPEVQWDA